MHSDINMFDLFFQASFFVQLVMLSLIAMSVFSWAIIFQRHRLLKEASDHVQTFEKTFWSGVDLNTLYKDVSEKKDNINGLERLFCAGVKEYLRLNSADKPVPEAVMNGTYRAMNISLSRELSKMEIHLPTLATIGSISPYVGLFGTVWGIMNSFIALGVQQNATLEMVAPGIAEALIATALGLFAAIPAVAAYNRFTVSMSKLESDYINFMDELSGILHRQTYSTSKAKK
ncbi:MAG: protein TolQ [Shewanellaceae bacterium]|nr:protein TolQ [Shewanellaceae bacterium]